MKVSAKRIIRAPKAELWKYLADYSNIQRFHPLLRASHFVDGTENCEIGSTRQCTMKDGNYIKERVIEWKEGSHYRVEIYETSMPLISAEASLGLRTISETETEAYMEMVLKPDYILMQPLLYLMNKYYAIPAILKGLDNTYAKQGALSLA